MGCHSTKSLFAVSLIDKKYEYVYVDLGSNQFGTVQLDHQKHKENLLKNARTKRMVRDSSAQNLNKANSVSNLLQDPELERYHSQRSGRFETNSQRPAKMNFRKNSLAKNTQAARAFEMNHN